MNDFTATIHIPARAEFWQQTLGTTTVPIKSFIPAIGHLPGIGEALIYELDVESLTAQQVEQLLAGLAQRFDLTPDEARQELAERGVPILAEGVTVTIHHPQRWLT